MFGIRLGWGGLINVVVFLWEDFCYLGVVGILDVIFGMLEFLKGIAFMWSWFLIFERGVWVST